MQRLRALSAVTLLAVLVLARPVAHAAVTVHFVGAGSSAMYQGFGIAVINELAPAKFPNSAVHHYTYKSSNCPSATCISFLSDPRTNPGTGQIPPEASTLWVVWACPGAAGPSEPACASGTTTDVWVYHQVDSTVGVRSLFSRDASGVGAAVRSNVTTSGVNNAANAISPGLLTSGFAGTATSCSGAKTCDDDALPADVQVAINNSGASPVQINAGLTVIRAEDAKAATKRANGPTSNSVSLGYGTVGSQLIGSAIWSSYSSTAANPVEFGLPGLPDPFNNIVVPPTITGFSLGQSPLLFIANRKNTSGLGAPDTITGSGFAYADLNDSAGSTNNLSYLFSGGDCSGQSPTFSDGHGNASFVASGLAANFPITLVQNDPVSGTVSVAEWTEFRTKNVCPGAACATNPWSLISSSYPAGWTQEFNVSPTLDNAGPANGLNKKCQLAHGVTGSRRRAIGASELVTGVLNTADTLGYVFFGFGNVSKLAAGGAGYGYLTIDGVDPIFPAYTGNTFTNNGQLPACTPGGLPDCSQGANGIWAGGGSFPHLRDGSYRAWSLLRVYCDTADAHCLPSVDPAGAQAILLQAQSDVAGGAANTFADYLPLSEVSYVRAHYNLLGGSHHALPFVHFFDQEMVSPSGTNDTLDVESSGNESGQWNGQGFANGGDAGGCVIPVDFSAPGSTGNNANNTVLKITKAHVTSRTQVRFTYSDVSGEALATLEGKGLTVEISVSGFASASPAETGIDGIYSLTTAPASGTFLATLVRSAGSLPATGTISSIAPANPNASAGNGNGTVGGVGVTNQCFQ